MNPSIAVILLNSDFGVGFPRFCLRGWGRVGYGKQAESLIILTALSMAMGHMNCWSIKV